MELCQILAALVSDYAPRTMRIKLVSLTLVSFAVGGALAPTVGVLLIQNLDGELFLSLLASAFGYSVHDEATARFN